MFGLPNLATEEGAKGLRRAQRVTHPFKRARRRGAEGHKLLFINTFYVEGHVWFLK